MSRGNPKGSMRQRGKESWELRVYVGRVNGRPQMVSRTFKGTEEAARQHLAEAIASMEEAGGERSTTCPHCGADMTARKRATDII